MPNTTRNVCGAETPPSAADLRARIARLKGVSVAGIARRLKYSRVWVETVINERDDSERVRRKVADLLDAIEAERAAETAEAEVAA